MMIFSKEDLLKHITFKTSRSGGKGGQNVNKVSSKVELNINIGVSSLFTDDQKAILFNKLANRINSEGVLQVITEEDRSQLINKQISVDKLIVLLKNALHQPRKRKATKPGKGAIEKRLKLKQVKAIKKINRRSDLWD
jgi:ribosome-associated protein